MDLSALPWATIGAAFVIALATPIILIAVRNHVRRARAIIVDEFEEVFEIRNNTSFEFAKSKYRGPDKLSWWKLYVSALPFMMVSFWGLILAFIPLRQTEQLDEIATIYEFIAPTMLTNGGLHGESSQYLENILTVATIAFVGSFLFALTFLVRAIANYDLAPLTFFRVTLNMLLAMTTATILWRAVPDLLPDFVSGKRAGAGGDQLGIVWYGAAFLIGFFPDLGLALLVKRIPLPLKQTRDDLLKQCAVASVEIIDGIDLWKRLRLEEMDIVDVQNLAAINPILLLIETPYGFYECFDWVAQAQLCTIAGPDRFIELRRRHVRTVIDFERTVLGPESTEQARRIVAEVLFATGPESKTFFEKWTRHPGPEKQGGGEQPSAYEPYDDATFKHFVKAMLDDLHVHRLRQVWIDIAHKLGEHSMTLTQLYEMEEKLGKHRSTPPHHCTASRGAKEGTDTTRKL
jgi:hypothetical protein